MFSKYPEVSLLSRREGSANAAAPATSTGSAKRRFKPTKFSSRRGNAEYTCGPCECRVVCQVRRLNCFCEELPGTEIVVTVLVYRRLAFSNRPRSRRAVRIGITQV
jgi:hypothetical protein